VGGLDDDRVRLWSPVGQAVALLLGPYAEVVLHDVASDRILAIWNPLSRRSPGEPSLLGELDTLQPSASDVYGPYEKLLSDGRRLSCISAILRRTDGEPDAVLCVNLDRTPLDQAATVLTAFAAPTSARPEALFEQDSNERIHQIVGAFVRATGRPVERLARGDRLAIVAELDEAGVFRVRRAVPVVAAALRASRSTVYSLLAELKTARRIA
jgi:D-arginine utilization repressor